MLSYQQVVNLETRLSDALDELKSAIMSDYLSDIKHELEYMARNDNVNIDNPERMRNDKMLNRLYIYLINGIPYDVAIRQIETDFNTPLYQFKNWMNAIHSRYNNDLRPYKIYAAHKLHAAGISNIKAAELLKTNPATVARFLKMKTDFKD